MKDRQAHWQQIYATRPVTAVSWFEPHAERSLRLIRAAAPDRAAPIIDVGGGASTLVDDLLADGYVDVTVLDIAEAGLAQARRRLGGAADKVDWIVADITGWTPPRKWTIWHDRAVFHFLVERAEQDAYIKTLTDATGSGSTVILGTFALDGPQRCSGLPVRRYDAHRLATRLGSLYRLTAQAHALHRTPSGAEQSFCWAVLARL